MEKAIALSYIINLTVKVRSRKENNNNTASSAQVELLFNELNLKIRESPFRASKWLKVSKRSNRIRRRTPCPLPFLI